MEGDDFQVRYANFMDTMFKSAVAETTKLFETMVDDLRSEISRIKKENEDLKSKCNEYENMKNLPTCDGEQQKDPTPGLSHAGDKRDSGVQCDLVSLQTILMEQLRSSSITNLEEGLQKEKGHHLENHIGEDASVIGEDAPVDVMEEESQPDPMFVLELEDDEPLLVNQSEISESLGISELQSVSQPSSGERLCSLQNDKKAAEKACTLVHIELCSEKEKNKCSTIPEVMDNMREHAEVIQSIPETLVSSEKLPDMFVGVPVVQQLEEQQSMPRQSVHIDNNMSITKQFGHVASTFVQLPEVDPITKERSPEVEMSQPVSVRRRKRGRPSKKTALCVSQQVEQGGQQRSFISISEPPSDNQPFSCQKDQLISEIKTSCSATDKNLNYTREVKIRTPEPNHPSVFTVTTMKGNMTNNSKVTLAITEISSPSETPEDVKTLVDEHLKGAEVNLGEVEAKSHPNSSKYKRGRLTKKATLWSLKSVRPNNTQQGSVNQPSTFGSQTVLQRNKMITEDFMTVDNVITCERGSQEQLPETGPFVIHPEEKGNVSGIFKVSQSNIDTERSNEEQPVVLADQQSLVQPSVKEKPPTRTQRPNEQLRDVPSTPEKLLEEGQIKYIALDSWAKSSSHPRKGRPLKNTYHKVCKTSFQHPRVEKVWSEATEVYTEQEGNVPSNSVKNPDVLSQLDMSPLKRGQATDKKQAPKSLSQSSMQVYPSESKKLPVKIKKKRIQRRGNETVETLTSESPKAPIRRPLTSYPSLQDAMLFLDAINSQCHPVIENVFSVQPSVTTRTPTQTCHSPQTDSIAIDHMYSQTTSNLHEVDQSDQPSAQQVTTSAQTVVSSIQNLQSSAQNLSSVHLKAAVLPTIQYAPILPKSVLSGLATQTSVLSQHHPHPDIASVASKKIIVVSKRIPSAAHAQACNILPDSKTNVTPSALSDKSVVDNPKTTSRKSCSSTSHKTVVPSSDHPSGPPHKVIIIMSGSMPTVVVRQQQSPVAPQAIVLPVQEPSVESILTATVSSDQQADVNVTKPAESLEPSLPQSQRTSKQQIGFSSQQSDVNVTKPTESLEPSLPLSGMTSEQHIDFSSHQSDVNVTMQTESVKPSTPESQRTLAQSEVNDTKPTESLEPSLPLSKRTSEWHIGGFSFKQSDDAFNQTSMDLPTLSDRASDQVLDILSPQSSVDSTIPLSQKLDVCDTFGSYATYSKMADVSTCSTLKNTISPLLEHVFLEPGVSSFFQNKTHPVVKLLKLPMASGKDTFNLFTETNPLGVHSRTQEKLSAVEPSHLMTASTTTSPAKATDIHLAFKAPDILDGQVPMLTNEPTAVNKTLEEANSCQPVSDASVKETISDSKTSTLSPENLSRVNESPVRCPVSNLTSLTEVSNSQPAVMQEETSVVKLTSLSKETSDPHLGMTKTQFLAQLAVTPVTDIHKKVLPNDVVGTRAISQATSTSKHKDSIVTRLRQITRSPVKAKMKEVCSEKPKSKAKSIKTNNAPRNSESSNFTDRKGMTGEQYSVRPRKCRLSKDSLCNKGKTNTKIDKYSRGIKRHSTEATPAKKPRLIAGSASTKNKLKISTKARTLVKINQSRQSYNSDEASPSAKKLASPEDQKVAQSKATWIPPTMVARKSQLTKMRTLSLPTKTEPRSHNPSPVKTPKRKTRSISPRIRLIQSPTSPNQSQKVIPIYGPKTRSHSSRKNVYTPSVSQYPIPIKAPPMVSPLQPLSVIGWRLLKNQCGECGCILSNQAELEKHVSLHVRSHPFSCHLCGKIFPDSLCLKRHGRVHRNGRIHVCQQCGKGFVYSFGLTKHLQMVHAKIRPFSCQFCSKGFFTKRDAEAHERVHTGEKPFPCNLCEKRFKRRVELNMHLRWHNGEKRHWCSFCGKGFLDYNNLKRHKMIHTGEKPCVCSHCPKKFTQSGHLKKHLKNVHKVI